MLSVTFRDGLHDKVLIKSQERWVRLKPILVFPPGFKKGRVQAKKGRVQLFTKKALLARYRQKKGNLSALSTNKGNFRASPT